MKIISKLTNLFNTKEVPSTEVNKQPSADILINKLPNELILAIFQFLNLKEISTFSLVAKKYRNLIKSNQNYETDLKIVKLLFMKMENILKVNINDKLTITPLNEFFEIIYSINEKISNLAINPVASTENSDFELRYHTEWLDIKHLPKGLVLPPHLRSSKMICKSYFQSLKAISSKAQRFNEFVVLFNAIFKEKYDLKPEYLEFSNKVKAFHEKR